MACSGSQRAAALTWDDLTEESDGSGRLNIAHSKTDQEGRGATLFVSTQTMEWLKEMRDMVMERPTIFGVTQGTLALRIAHAAHYAGLEGRYGGHSMRIGMAQDLAPRPHVADHDNERRPLDARRERARLHQGDIRGTERGGRLVRPVPGPCSHRVRDPSEEEFNPWDTGLVARLARTRWPSRSLSDLAGIVGLSHLPAVMSSGSSAPRRSGPGPSPPWASGR